MGKFSYEENGYNRSEVNEFITEVITKTDEVIAKYKQQEKQIDRLQNELKHYEEVQGKIKDAVVLEESEQIIRDAKQDASEIINDALKTAEEVERQRELLEKNMEIFKKKLKLIMEQQNIIIDRIDELEIEDK